MKNISIATWNLRHGGGSRINNILEVILENKNIDIIVLTEFRNNQNKLKIESQLRNLNFLFIETLDVDSKLNSVLIASKTKFDEVENFQILDIHFQRILRVKTEGLNIYGCYFPGQNLKKVVFEFLLNEIKNKGKENTIITGDINTGKHYLDETGATFYHSSFLEKFETLGLVDAWRKVNGEKKEYSWYSNSGNGFRIDHFFIDEYMADNIVNCNYKHIYREEKVSDHSMMILELRK